MYSALRPLLFALPPEFAHNLAFAALRGFGALPASAPPPGTGVELLGLTFPNRIGLAAGLDKDATATAGLAKLGFGFLEVGTVTPRPQPGNPKPRLFRLKEDLALINRMGFNSAGADAVAMNLRRIRDCVDVPVGVNIGKNRVTPVEAAAVDYRACLAATYDVADYVVVNLSSPNTPGLRDLQAADAARDVVGELVAERQRLAVECPEKPRLPPLFVKIAPDFAPGDLEETVAAAMSAGADGIVATNTTVSRPVSLRSNGAVEAGGLSGRPLFPLALQAVRRTRDAVGEGPVIIGVGGISSAADSAAMFDAGADLVQVYSALVFQGPALVKRLAGGS
ncbi:MAG: quinone-dependent dihydroorotate dehydrogenase [Gammaproteobacteria bacterium]|nr:quinone-dependent dihydroorotate dehydrogenase [Gammaproteobacteria bacterium]